jgi:chromosome segregation ATPase
MERDLSFQILSLPLDDGSGSSSEVLKNHDFRAQQLLHLQQLQRVLDENIVLRAKFNALQAQVAPLESASRPSALEITEPRLPPERIEEIKLQLQRTLTLYREDVAAAGKIDQTLERLYREFSDMKMRLRMERDERMMHQNTVAANAITAFKMRGQRIRSGWELERRRLTARLAYFNEQTVVLNEDISDGRIRHVSNSRAIQTLTTSIKTATSDLKDFEKQRNTLLPQITEFKALEETLQNAETVVVTLNDTLESLESRVNTDSLKAQVKTQLDQGNAKVTELNRLIDDVQGKLSGITTQIQQTRRRISELNQRAKTVAKNTQEVRTVLDRLTGQRAVIKDRLLRCRQAGEEAGGARILLEKVLQSGFSSARERPWFIRKELLALKGNIRELDDVEEKVSELERELDVRSEEPVHVPQRRRVPMIPMLKL